MKFGLVMHIVMSSQRPGRRSKLSLSS